MTIHYEREEQVLNRLNELNGLNEHDQQLLAAWNDTKQDFPLDVCLPQLVEQHAEATPEAIALVYGEQSLTYKVLNARANQLAHHLHVLGIQANMPVGLYLERSLDMVVGLLGILKAGGAYVPLDPAYPPERLNYMIEDAQLHALVTRRDLLNSVSAANTQAVCIDTDAAKLAEQSESNPVPVATSHDLAYIIYTSGSTGKPKGVQIAHRSLLNLVFWHNTTFGVTAADRATQVTSPAFDATGWELWPYLAAGASVYLTDEETRVSPSLLRDFIIKNNIAVSFVSTAIAEIMLTLEWPTNTTLRFLLTGADALRQYPPASLPFQFINNYGPTEDTVVATSGRILPTTQVDESPSIGRPIANTQVYILDEELRQVPIGTVGELYIGGVGLAQGYRNRPELTAERFIEHPFSNEPGERLYKTGDLVRYLPDGQIAFLGRSDHQVKIRGFRIELGEIEATLSRHPSVRQAVVIARESATQEKHLVAYVVSEKPRSSTGQILSHGAKQIQFLHAENSTPAPNVSATELQHFLRSTLPDYMVPAIIVFLDEMPLTANGKIDRVALPAPETIRVVREVIEVEEVDETDEFDEEEDDELSPIEEQVTQIVAELMHLEEVALDDNFFLLGGHSLLGAQLITRVTETFDVQLTLRALFEAATIRQVSAEIERLIIAKIEAMSEDEALELLGQD